MWLVEETSQCFGDCAAYPVNGRNVCNGPLIGLRESLADLANFGNRPKGLKQIARRDGANMPDTKAKKQFCAIGSTSSFNRCQQVIHRLILPSAAQ